MPRSLKLRQSCIAQVKLSLLRNGFPSQRLLADHLQIAQSTVSHFLNGKPVDFVNFVELCQVLGQEWRDLADLESEPPAGQVKQTEATPYAATVLISADQSGADLIAQLQRHFAQTQHRIAIAPTPFLATALQSFDYWLLLLSEQSAVSEATLAAVQLVKEAWDTAQQPTILPIAVNLPWRQHLPFDLLGYLQDSQPWQWQLADSPTRLATALLDVFDQRRRALPAHSEFAISWKQLAPVARGPALPLPTASPEIPGGQMDLESRFYIERPPIEFLCYEAIAQPGALIRIKAPRQMGKTSLMARILHRAEQHGARVVPLSLQLANQRVFSQSDTFLQWFCASVSLELGLLDSEQLAKHWQLADLIGSNQCCKAYFEQYLLPQLRAPLVLGLDEVDRVFNRYEVAADFFGLLRALHEEGKRREIWKRVGLVVVHSTEVYMRLDINQSPFNVGLGIELGELTPSQVEALVERYELKLSVEEVEAIMELVGGHPFLLRLALYGLAHLNLSITQLLKTAPSEGSIYGDHLRRHLSNLDGHPLLKEAFREVVFANDPVRLPSEQAFKLSSMGLVKLAGNDGVPRCQLYRQYFRHCLA